MIIRIDLELPVSNINILGPPMAEIDGDADYFSDIGTDRTDVGGGMLYNILPSRE